MPIKFSEREQSLLILTLAALVFYLSYHFLFSPTWSEIDKLKDKARGQRLELRIAEEKLRILDAVEKKYGSLPGKSSLPAEEKALEIFKSISQATSKSRLSLISIQPIIEPGKEGYKFNLSCSGRYKNLYDFLVLLQRYEMLVFIDNLEITRGEGAELGMKLALTAYY